MSSKKTGFFPLLAGFAAGAAAVFFSKPENRQKAKTQLNKAAKTAKKINQEVKTNPQAFKKKIKKEGQKMAKSVVKQITTTKPAPGKKSAVTKAETSPSKKVTAKK